jgi:hypothetical protein
VDACVQSHSRHFAFTRGMADERAMVLFDKAGAVRYREPDAEALQAEVLARVDHLERGLTIYPTWVRKQIRRGRFLEALAGYHKHILAPLVEALRLRHAPTKRGYGLKDATGDLPAEAVARLEQLYRAGDVEAIERSLPVALDLLQEALTVVRRH